MEILVYKYPACCNWLVWILRISITAWLTRCEFFITVQITPLIIGIDMKRFPLLSVTVRVGVRVLKCLKRGDDLVLYLTPGIEKCCRWVVSSVEVTVFAEGLRVDGWWLSLRRASMSEVGTSDKHMLSFMIYIRGEWLRLKWSRKGVQALFLGPQ